MSLPWFPDSGGIRFRLFTFQPNSKTEEAAKSPELTTDEPAEAPQSTTGDSATDEPSNFLDAYDPAKPGAHKSDTVDFVHVLYGEVVLELDDREVELHPGDLVIMRGTWHVWRNDTTEPCTVSSVMVGATRLPPAPNNS